MEELWNDFYRICLFRFFQKNKNHISIEGEQNIMDVIDKKNK